MKTGIIALNVTGNATLTYYVQEPSPELSNVQIRPAILIFPGGGYQFCSDREAEPVALSFLAQGYQAFILRYSLKDQAAFPNPLRDAEEALETLIEHAGEWFLDPERVAVLGYSAGGHLAATLGVAGRVRPRALLLGYPCILPEMEGVLPHPIPDASQVDGRTPPAFLFTTSDDALVPVRNSLRFADAMDRAGIPFELHVFRHGVHGLSLGTELTSDSRPEIVEPAFAGWFSMSLAFLQGVFRKFS